MKHLSISAAIGAVVLTVLQLVEADLSKVVRVNPDTQHFIDAQGRSRFFHGTNMVKKSFPWHLDVNQFVPGRSIVDKDIQALKALNINSVRLGVHWAGVEPVRGQYNQTYLDISRGIIQKLQDNGIYTLVDQHQDVWSAQTCGHGAPLWFVKSDWVTSDHRMPYPQKAPFAVDANGVPSDADCNSIDWSTSYLDYAVGNAFGRLYNNYDNLGDAWAQYWKTVSSNVKDLPGVQGYDLMNEPWVGDHMADPTLLTPGVADHVNMEPLWNKGNTAIRTVDPTTIVFFEGSTYDILSGFNNVPGGDGSKTAQSYHYYNPPQLGKIQDTLTNRVKDATRLKTTGMLTEFQFWDSGADSRAAILNTAKYADTFLQSWQGWAYENLWDGTTQQPIPELARIYARTYAEATAGATKTLYFQDETAKYWVSWVADTSITAPGLIRIAPQIYYPDGIRVFFVPVGTGTYTMDGTNTVQLHYTAAAQNGQTIQASVQPFFPTDIIKNPASGKCVDNGNGYVTSNNPVILWTCSSAANQVWKFKNGTISLAFDPSRQSDTYCLDTMGAATASSQTVVLNPCQAGSASQQWKVTPTGNILNNASNKCLDINGSIYKDGTGLLTYACGAGGAQANQVWTLPRGADGTW
ncbi:MAG: glycoside hydrolase superfamily [Podila humilis]|nr:MAG: glycoside hydrolase superfamily [Podila humilis]